MRLFDAVERLCQLPQCGEAPGADGGDDIQDLALGVGHRPGLCPGHGCAESGERQVRTAHVHRAEVKGGGHRGHGAVRS
jgi:hypothetical protein